MSAQVDDKGNIHVLFDVITNHRQTGLYLKQADEFISTSSGNKWRQETTKGWDMLIRWKDGLTTWFPLKYMKESYPVQVSEYAVPSQIQEEPHLYGGFLMYYEKGTI